jgi:hypothetical protein
VQPGKLASACVLIASARQREVWRAGNSTFVIGGAPHVQRWRLVEVPAGMRAIYLRALLRAGAVAPDDLRRHDPGQELIAPLLRIEHVFHNATDAGDLAYAVVDGLEVPHVLIERAPLAAASTSSSRPTATRWRRPRSRRPRTTCATASRRVRSASTATLKCAA